jgi:hypothetical protein
MGQTFGPDHCDGGQKAMLAGAFLVPSLRPDAADV